MSRGILIMTVSDLIDAILAKTLSPDHQETQVLAILNRGMVEIAGGGDRMHGEAKLAPLPDLFATDTVTLTGGDSYVAMPTDYQRGLVIVKWGDEELKRADDHIRFIREYGGETGNPEAYSLKGTSLWVGPTPSDDTELTVYYYRLPTALEAEDTITELPESLQYKLLFNYACREIYSDIEQGIEGANPDTTKHDMLYQRALTDLERLIGAEEGEAININDGYSTDENILY